MDLKSIYREIVNEHNLHPGHKYEMENAAYSLQGVNPTCGDDITLNLTVNEEGKISAGAFAGAGCAVSQASTDIMLDLIEGRTPEEALALVESFMHMVHGTATDEELEALDEAQALKDVAHMPARAKCATLAWHTLEKMIREQIKEQ